MNHFDSWARKIAAGDLLSQNVSLPLHDWHREVADEHYRLHPEEFDAAKSAGRDPAEAIWDRWCGQKRFYQDPLYSYLVAATYRLLGSDARWVLAWQMAIGVLGNVLVYLIARKCFGALVAVVTAALAVLCAPMMYYEMLLLRETLLSFAGLALVYLTILAVERRRWPWWLAAGAAAGVSVLLKAHFALFVALTAVAVAAAARIRFREIATSWAAMAIGLLAAMIPLAARNTLCGVSPFVTTSAGGVTFIAANTPDYDGSGFFVTPGLVAPIMDKTGGKLLPSMVETLRTYHGPGSYLALLWAKFAATWHWFEVPNNSSFYYFRLHSSVLRYMPVTFFLISPLAMVGLVLAARKYAKCWPLYLMVATNLAVLMMFHVMSRHRRPLLSVLIPFAALAVVSVARWLFAKRARGAVALGCVVALGVWTSRPLPPGALPIRSADYAAAHEHYYLPQAGIARENGDHRRAAELIGQALAIEPPRVRSMTQESPPGNADELALAQTFAVMHLARGVALRDAALRDEAVKHLSRAAELGRLAHRAGPPGASTPSGADPTGPPRQRSSTLEIP